MRNILLLSLSGILALCSCNKNEILPGTGSAANCKLTAIELDGFIGTEIDSIDYVNGRISSIRRYINGQRSGGKLYVYQNATSLRIYDLPLSGDTSGAPFLQIGLHASGLPYRLEKYPDYSLTTITYTSDDSIRIYDGNNDLMAVMYINAQGNPSFMQLLPTPDDPTDKKVHLSYDNRPNPLKGLYYYDIDNFHWSTNNLKQSMYYENGSLISTTNYDLGYDINGKINSWGEDNFALLRFKYNCN